MIVHFLMAMPSTTSTPAANGGVVRLSSLDQSGALKLSGCLPLIHPVWHHIVVVDPQDHRLRSLSAALTQIGYTVTSLSSLEEAANVVVENLVDLVICSDQRNSGSQGWCGELRKRIESTRDVQTTTRPLPPIIKSMEFSTNYVPIAPRIDQPEIDLFSEQQQQETSMSNDNNNRAKQKLSRFHKIKIELPVETKPQKNLVATTVAQVLGVVKLVGM
jgi:DNA-binding NtrC family response regulator